MQTQRPGSSSMSADTGLDYSSLIRINAGKEAYVLTRLRTDMIYGFLMDSYCGLDRITVEFAACTIFMLTVTFLMAIW